MRLVPVSREAHRCKKVRQTPSYAFVRASGVISLYGLELAHAAHEFPICFTREPDGFFPAALMAIEPGRNVFVSVDGQWLGNYVPAVLRRAPFALARVGETDDWILCVDEASELLADHEGQPLFMEDGQPSPLIAQITEFLVELERNRILTRNACAALARHGLLAPWPLQVADGKGQAKRIDGLFKVDESKMRDLSADALVELRDAGALMVAYAQLISVLKLPVIGRLADVQNHLEAQRQAASIQPGLDLDRAFGNTEDEPFNLDFV